MTPLESLRALGLGEEPPTAAKERVYGALQLSLEAAALAAAAAKVAVPARASLRHALAPSTVAKSAASAKLVLWGVGVLLLGGVVGAVVYDKVRPSPVKVVYIDRPVLVSAPATPAEPARAVPSVAAPPVPTSPSVNREPVRVPAAGDTTSELARERALLDTARKSAAQSDPERVLQISERHRAEFPSGRLSEEREAMAIRALFTLGRTDEAHQRALAFHAAYPNSFLAGVVDSAASGP